MQEQELINILKAFYGFNPDMLYDDLIIIDKEHSGFNEHEHTKFTVFYSMLAAEQVPYEEYQDVDKKLHQVRATVLENIKTAVDSHCPDWIEISPPKNNVAENMIKIYLSIDNQYLHFFANQLFLACLERGYLDFNFKINNDSRVNRRDNVVVYCNQNNFGMYVELIQDLIAKFPNIKFNSPHLLGIPYDEQIYCGIDEDEKTSYTEKLCQAIFTGMKNGRSIEDIVSKINATKEKQMPAFKALAEQSKKKCS